MLIVWVQLLDFKFDKKINNFKFDKIIDYYWLLLIIIDYLWLLIINLANLILYDPCCPSL